MARANSAKQRWYTVSSACRNLCTRSQLCHLPGTNVYHIKVLNHAVVESIKVKKYYNFFFFLETLSCPYFLKLS